MRNAGTRTGRASAKIAWHASCILLGPLSEKWCNTQTSGPGKFHVHGRLQPHGPRPQVLKDLYRRLVQQGLRMVCIVTKVDLIDPRIEADTVNVVFSSHVHHLRQFVSAETGMPANQVSRGD